MNQKISPQPLVSLIIPIYNVADFLSECLDSIVSQSYDNIEIILVNDGSTDDSEAVCDRFITSDPRVKYIHQENQGVSVARNAGIEVATGTYLMFIDSDDIVAPNIVEVLLSDSLQFDADIAICQYRKFTTSLQFDNIPTSDLQIPRVQAPFSTIEGMLYQTEIGAHPWGRIYKRALFHSLRFPVGVKVGEDLYMNYWAFRSATKIAVRNDKLYGYRIRSGSAMSSAVPEDRLAAFPFLREMEADIFLHSPTSLGSIRNRIFAAALYMLFPLPKSMHGTKTFATGTAILKENGLTVLIDRRSKGEFRMYALIGQLSWTMAITMLATKAKIGHRIRQIGH